MTRREDPCSDGTRRWAHQTLRVLGVVDHHALLPWRSVTSLSRESGVTEGQVLDLVAWVRAGRPPEPVAAPRYTGRVSLGRPRVAAPAPAVEAPPQPPVAAEAAKPVVPVARTTGRPQGRVSLRGMRTAVPPVVDPVVEQPSAPVVVAVPDPYAVPSDVLRGPGYVQPLTASGMPWRRPTTYRRAGATRSARLLYDPLGLFAGEPHGPPCPAHAHPELSARVAIPFH